MITILTGPSTAGKSTVVTALRKQGRVPGLTVVEVDDVPPPEVGTDYWRRYRIELLLHEAVGREGPTLISGALWPHEVLASESCDPVRVGFLVLSLSPRVLANRLQKRLEGRKPDDVAALLRVNRRLSDALTRQSAGLRNATVIDVSRLTRYRVLAAVTDHLNGSDG